MKQLVPNLEIIGKTKDSGYKNSVFLIKTPEKKFIQLTELLFQTVAALKNESDLASVAAIVSKQLGKEILPWQIAFLIDKKLVPLGIITDENHTSSVKKETYDSMLGLSHRVTLLPEQLVNRVTNILRPFFLLPILITLLVSFACFDYWLFQVHGLKSSIDQTVNQPFLFLLDFGLLVLSGLFHEFGHAAACTYGGGKPGRIGSGFYLIWPAFFTDLTDVYRLNRFSRLRSDLGGVYFNAVFSLLIAGVYFLTQFEPLLIIIVFQNFEILQQLIPFIRMDGYFIVSDIVGLPDLFAKMKPILKSILPGQDKERVDNLKPWVIRTVILWVAVTVPLLGYYLITMLLNIPEVFISAKESAITQMNAINTSFATDDYIQAIIQGLQLIILLLPTLGIFLITYRLAISIFNISYRFIVKMRMTQKTNYHSSPIRSQPIIIFQANK
ncbi:MAG: hypothetical protein ACREHC_02640 [Candidatus Levyibacteriota bacterium]